MSAWAAIGGVLAFGLWNAWSIVGAVLMLAAIAAAFVAARVIGLRAAWAALLVCGLAMTITLSWAAATSARCPAPGERVTIKQGKPPVTCDELRAAQLSMAVLFALAALAGLGWGVQARRPRAAA